jgi:hypothetical protein
MYHSSPKYSQYATEMNALDSDDLYRGLLCYGMFAEKLPPVFTSEQFFEYCIKLENAPEARPRQFIFFESVRNINTPRPMGIPHPMAYQQLCNCLCKNWHNLRKHFAEKTKNHRYKISRIHIRKLKDKCSVFEMNYLNHKIDGDPELNIKIGKKYLVRADISNCFPSIYSHALPWALVGKEEAKKNKSPKEDCWYNEIDRYTRNLKDGETHGLLIGCHACNVLSEIILVAIDEKLHDKGWRYVRNIDDYTCYVETQEKAQKFLIDLVSALRSYDLTLNHKKTAIFELPFGDTEQWVSRLNAFPLPETDSTEKKLFTDTKVKAYLDCAIELMQDNKNNSAILNYAIKTVFNKRKCMTDDAKSYFTKTVFHLVLLFPYLIPLLDEYIFRPFNIEFAKIRKTSELIYENAKNEQNFEAMYYAIYFALKYNFELKVEFTYAKETQNCLILLFSWLYAKKNNLEDTAKYTDYAKDLLKDDKEFEQNWIFVYEVLGTNDLQNHSEWFEMKKAQVSFLNLKV